MKNLLLTLFAVCIAAAYSFGQSNEQGTIQVGLGYGITIGGATIDLKDTSGTTSGSGAGLRIFYGIRAQYGLSEKLSAGVYLAPEAALYVTDFTDPYGYVYSRDVTYSGIGFGLEGKFYLVNKDKLNLFPCVAIGFKTGTATSDDIYSSSEASISGIGYGFGVGVNWYFVKEVFGLSMELGYAGSSLTGTEAATSYTDKRDVTLSNGGVVWGLGFTAHFGGN